MIRLGVKLSVLSVLALFALSYGALAESRAAVDVAAWYPKGNDYIFICALTDFNASRYDWSFGDGEKLYDVTNGNVFHRFANNGTYSVTCAGENEQGRVVGYRQVTVGTVTPPPPVDTTNTSASVSIAQWYPKGNDYVFYCTANGFTATSYDWNFGDGQKLVDMTTNNVFHRFAGNGTYTVSCEAEAEGHHADSYMTVTVQ